MNSSARSTLLHAAVCGILITAFCLINRYHLFVVLVHVALCAGLYSACAMMQGAGTNEKSARFIHATSTALVTSMLLIIYIGSFVSNAYWKANINLNLLARFAGSYWMAGKYFPVMAAFLSVALLFLIVFAVYFKRYKKEAGHHKLYNMLVFIVAMGMSYVGLEVYAKEQYIGEPIVEFFAEHANVMVRAPLSNNNAPASGKKQPANGGMGQPNIVLIIVDALRPDRISSYGYPRKTDPFISSMGGAFEVDKIENAYSMCNESACGILSFLMSRSLPAQTVSNVNESLQRILKDNGYKVNFFLAADHSLVGLSKYYSYVDHYIDGSLFKGFTQTDDRGVLTALGDLPDFDKQPQFFYLHLMSAHTLGTRFDTHQPILKKPSGADDAEFSEHFQAASASSQDRKSNDYDNGVYQADAVIQNIFDILAGKGYLQNSLVVITADHGDGLGEHGYYGHVSGLYRQDIKIPLLFVNMTNRKLDLKETFFATQLDVAPTLLQHIGIAAPESWEGKALQVVRHDEQVTTHYIPDRSESFAKVFYQPATHRIFKYLYLDQRVGILPPKIFLFDELNDPFEKQNILAGKSDNYQDALNARGFVIKEPSAPGGRHTGSH